MTTEAERLTSVEAKLDGFIEETRSRFNDMNDRFNDMNDRFNDTNTNMNSRFNDMSTGMNNRMSSIENRLNIQIGLIVTIGVTMVLTVLFRT